MRTIAIIILPSQCQGPVRAVKLLQKSHRYDTSCHEMPFKVVLVFFMLFVGIQSQAERLKLPEITVNSQVSGQVFPTFLHPTTRHIPRGTIVKIHGGGCGFTRSPGDRSDSYVDILDVLLNTQGYNVATIDYSVNLQTIGSRVEENCASNVREEILRIQSLVAQLQRMSYGQAPIYLLGHSFGAYLVNYLASSKFKISGIAGYISVNGIWDSRESLDSFGKLPLVSSIYDPLENSSENLSPILIFSTDDDENIIPNDQIERFNQWSVNSKAQHTTIRLTQGGHGYSDEHFRSNLKRLVEEVNKFTALNNMPEMHANSDTQFLTSLMKPDPKNFIPVLGVCHVRFQSYRNDIIAFIDHTSEDGTVTSKGVESYDVSEFRNLDAAQKFLNSEAEKRVRELQSQGWCSMYSNPQNGLATQFCGTKI